MTASIQINTAPKTWQMYKHATSIVAFAAGIAIPLSTTLQNVTLVIISLNIVCLYFIQWIPAYAGMTFRGILHRLKMLYKQPLIISSTLLYCFLILGCFWSNAPTHDIVHRLIKMLWLVLIPFLSLFFIEKDARRFAIIGFISGNVLALLLSYIAFISHHPLLHGIKYPDNPWVPFRGHAYHCYFLGLSVLIILHQLLHKKVIHRLIMWSAIMFIVLAIIDIYYLIYSRTGQLNFILMLAIFLILWHKKLGMLIMALVVFVGLPIIIITSHTVQARIHSAQSDILNYHHGIDNTSIGYRMAFHHYSWQLIAQSPILGYGTGNFDQAFDHITAEHQDTRSLTTTNPHSDYLLFGVELGTLGIIGLVAIFATLIWQASKHPLHIYKSFGIIVAITYAISCFENSFITDNVSGVAFAFITALILASMDPGFTFENSKFMSGMTFRELL